MSEKDESPDVIGPSAPMPTEGERRAAWRRRYIARMVQAGVDERNAIANFEAVGFEPDAGFDLTDDPEQCADDEMTYWSEL